MEGNMVTTKLDEKTLMEVAMAGKGIYVRAISPNTGLNSVYDEINKLEKSKYELKIYTDFAEMFQWPFCVALVLLLAESLISNKKTRLKIFG